ncbi:hypothetical protein EMIHUDRAFT_97052 [Emiliania huxleyi CCMP1516]|uniref:BTB domain-containing protein n=2 Tax=Emiliania huxleyi TaxID=2903 RepID=A0A0D3I7K1_EMIH1|nr:hypothetical protein EMIHUDRAFT_97052 [Emiliania huxleyi CCMP1516]EOD07236.1 hypothetical protein EMIHUDRAFT_97052 [Emiliania huxleyi CCMP1516]|eukprot:XP_005759665.1 hypothetical protein EMIHUDRAFT_97052 [Emiliania huxleyi CCMP1516]
MHAPRSPKRPAPADDAADGYVKLIGGTPFPEALQEQREAGDFCDAVIMAGGQRFVAHRAVLAGTSLYFRGMYKSMMADSHDAHTLPAISADSFAAMLSWMYKGRCVLGSNDELVPVLEAASLLQVHPLRDTAAVAIAKRLTADSCVGAWDLAERLSLDALRDEARTACLACWPELRAAPEKLATIKLDRLADLLGDDCLKVQEEAEVLDAIDAWVSAQKPSAPSEEAVARLVAQVRFPLLSAEQCTQAASQPCMQGAAAMKAAFLSLATRKATERQPCWLQEGGAPGEFVWSIAQFSALEERTDSPIFEYAGIRWCLLVFPRGNKADSLAVYLKAVDAATKPCAASFCFTIPSAKSDKSVTKDSEHKFESDKMDWGFREMILLAELRDPECGYLAEDKLTISLKIRNPRLLDSA